MPSSTQGLSGNEILSYVQQFFGNYAADFQSWLTTLLPMAEMRYCKMHDWNFLNVQNCALTLTSGTNQYSLSTATVGYYIPAANVRSIYSPTARIYLKKISLDEIRRLDPATIADQGGSQYLMYWCEVGDNSIIIYPPYFGDPNVYIDGKIVPTALLTLSNYPTIPYRYQESFLQYILGIAAGRENDDRAPALKQEAIAAIRMDIQSDLAILGNTDEPRIRHMNENRLDGISPNSDPLNMIFDPYTNY